MPSAVVSLPSFVMLASVLKKKTIVKLVTILTFAIILIGYTFNLLQPHGNWEYVGYANYVVGAITSEKKLVIAPLFCIYFHQPNID